MTLDHLSDGIWITPEPVVVSLEKALIHEQFGHEFARLHDGGAKVEVIAKKFDVNVSTVHDGIRFARSGALPPQSQQPAPLKKQRFRRTPLYLEIKDDVARLRDQEGLTFPEIQAWFRDKKSVNPSEPTLRRAYDAAHPERLDAALRDGTCVFRGKVPRHNQKLHAEIRRLLSKGVSAEKIAAKVGCGVMTVYRVKRKTNRVKEQSENGSL